MIAPSTQLTYAGEAFREGWQILRKWPVLWLVILGAGLPSILISRMYRLAIPSNSDPGSFAWSAEMATLSLVNGFVVLMVTAVMALWVRGCLRGALLPAKQVLGKAGRLWCPILIFQVCLVVLGAGFAGWGQWFVKHADVDRWGFTTFVLFSFWIPVGVSQAVRFAFWALVPGVVLAKDLRGSLRLSFEFVRRFPVLVIVLIIVDMVWGFGVCPLIGNLITAKTFHLGLGWFDNPMVTYSVLGWTVGTLLSLTAQWFLTFVQLVSVWKRLE